MTTKTRWLVGVAIVAAMLAVSAGFAVARDGGAPQVPGGMMGGSSDGMMGSGSAVDGMMGSGMGAMMSGVDMDAMHEQMMAALAGKVPADLLARCDALHDQMWSDGGTDGAQGSGHSAHHGNVGSTG
jgi:hypothetical protein